jgi:hypothetical protein
MSVWRRFHFLEIVLFALGLCAIWGATFLVMRARNQEVIFGVTFSNQYASSFSVDWQEAYEAMLDDLHVRYLRIPIYWSEVEAEPGVYDFSSVDWMIQEAAERGAVVTLAIGEKVPRWPECYVPIWYEKDDERQEALLVYLETVVNRYRSNPALSRWQVENERFFPFGICPAADAEFVNEEIALVRSLDDRHPIQLTTSGEQSIWVTTAIPADIVGASLYRLVYNEKTGYLGVPLRPFFYRLQAFLASFFAEEVMISELQAEPWNAYRFISSDPAIFEEGYGSFSVQNFVDHVNFARQSGIHEVYLWGVEWWYYLHAMGDDRLWDVAREVF